MQVPKGAHYAMDASDLNIDELEHLRFEMFLRKMAHEKIKLLLLEREAARRHIKETTMLIPPQPGHRPFIRPSPGDSQSLADYLVTFLCSCDRSRSFVYFIHVYLLASLTVVSLLQNKSVMRRLTELVESDFKTLEDNHHAALLQAAVRANVVEWTTVYDDECYKRVSIWALSADAKHDMPATTVNLCLCRLSWFISHSLAC